VQTLTTLPNFVSWVIVFSLTFGMISREGVISTILLNAGIIKNPLTILGNAKVAWYFQTAIGVWKGLGWNSIIYLAAIAGVDQELYDAAAIDGCGRFRSIMNVTLPGILPTYFVLLILSISGLVGSDFEKLFVFQNPLVINKLETIDIYTYELGIVYNEYSYGIAVGIFKSVVSVMLLFVANNISKYFRGQKIF
jgi:putative aldouronate transport system permease protein